MPQQTSVRGEISCRTPIFIGLSDLCVQINELCLLVCSSRNSLKWCIHKYKYIFPVFLINAALLSIRDFQLKNRNYSELLTRSVYVSLITDIISVRMDQNIIAIRSKNPPQHPSGNFALKSLTFIFFKRCKNPAHVDV